MRNVDAGVALAFAADGLTAVAAAFNTAWLGAYWLGPGRRRRLSALTLVAVNAGIAVQALFAQALYTAHRFDADIAPFFATAPWVAARALLLAGTLMLSLLILRRSPQ